MAGMIDWTFDVERLNLSLLHDELKAALGPKFVGVSWNGRAVRVHVLDSTSAGERALVKSIVEQHDPARLTARQQAERDRRAMLAGLRSKPWTQWTPADKDALLRVLAENLDTLGVG